MRCKLVAYLQVEDGRKCCTVIHGEMYPDTYWDQGGFEPMLDDACGFQWMDGTEFSEEEYEKYIDDLFNRTLDEGEVVYPEEFDLWKLTPQ